MQFFPIEKLEFYTHLTTREFREILNKYVEIEKPTSPYCNTNNSKHKDYKGYVEDSTFDLVRYHKNQEDHPPLLHGNFKRRRKGTNVLITILPSMWSIISSVSLLGTALFFSFKNGFNIMSGIILAILALKYILAIKKSKIERRKTESFFRKVLLKLNEI